MKRFDADRTSLPEIVSSLRKPSPRAEEEERLVAEIVAAVRDGGDEALLKFARQFDSPLITQRSLFVSPGEIEAAYAKVDGDFLSALEAASQRIEAFHRRSVAQMRPARRRTRPRDERAFRSANEGGGHPQTPARAGLKPCATLVGEQPGTSWTYEEDGVLLGQKFTPIEKVACCVPARAAPLPSSLLMTAIPARVAGVGEITVMCAPKPESAEVDPHILAAARAAGLDRVLRVSGAQGVAALAFGTQSVPKVHKIVGPGNAFVTLAKKMVFGAVGIDSLAGPSEIVVLADSSADPALVAAELLSQAEHSHDAVAVAVSESSSLLAEVENQVQEQLAELERAETARISLAENGALVKVDGLEQGIDFANLFAPEHLQLAVSQPKEAAKKIRNAGAIFLGQTTPEALGDYIAGPSHVLPTGGTALFSSPLSVLDFLKCSSLIASSKEALARLAPHAIRLAQAEGLTAHAKAVGASADFAE